MDFWLIFLSLISVALLVYFYIHQKYSFWSRLGVPGPAPSLLSFGTVGKFLSQNPFKPEMEFFHKYGKMYGLYNGLRPSLSVAEPELLKQIMVRDFHLFVDQVELHTDHELVNRIVFLEEAKRWKRLRTITSPCFSSAKLKAMYSNMGQSVDLLLGYFDKLIQTENGFMPDTRKVMVGFSLDVIASSVFGVQTEWTTKDTESNAFLLNALKLFDTSAFTMIGVFIFPLWLNNLLNIKHFFNVDAWNFFEKLGKEIVRKRRANESAKRNDLIDLLIDSQVDETVLDGDNYEKLGADLDGNEEDSETNPKSGNKTSKKLTLSENEIIAQAIGFMIGGYDTTASTLTHCIFELTQNPDIQERLNQEIESVLGNLEPNTQEYYDSVNTIPYLDAVIKETMRKYPPFTRLSRILEANAKDYKLGNTGLVLQGGQTIELPLLSLHYNPEYFPEPERFLPDRFMPENKHQLVPYSFIPFGGGPRNCIGIRFATQELKICLAKMCQKYRFVPTGNTPKGPLEFVPFKIILTSNPVEVQVVKRSN